MSDSRTPRRSPAASDPRLEALAEDSGYEVLGRIGTGGMGIVYRAHDADGNDVAIKMLRHEIADDPRARERLAREVTAQQRVRNDNIVRILDAELESSDAFVVTEFVPGPTLEDAVRTHGGLHPEAVREVGLVLGETLRVIHEAGVIHRDLKPSNVLLRGATEEDLSGFDPDGDGLDPVIIDFGIAIAAEESRLTSTGLVMGTAAYLDPEVVRTDRTVEAGDWWSWAAMLAFAATGREPFGTGRADLVFLRAERGEIDIDGVPTELGDWLRSALCADPAERATPEELLARLAELDLDRYDDPGDTEAFEAGPRTAVLPVLGADGAPAAGAATPTDDAEGTGAEGATEALPAGDAATEALPRVADAGEQP
ncbi:MAG: serine/threonine-protein kinase, partial [Brachybacterium sp.]|uniref:serine/threonine-protein kinase n=1 Tax=Brachybacterium sp. TaxID=1891286 RepID=UPI003242DCAE